MYSNDDEIAKELASLYKDSMVLYADVVCRLYDQIELKVRYVASEKDYKQCFEDARILIEPYRLFSWSGSLEDIVHNDDLLVANIKELQLGKEPKYAEAARRCLNSNIGVTLLNAPFKLEEKLLRIRAVRNQLEKPTEKNLEEGGDKMTDKKNINILKKKKKQLARIKWIGMHEKGAYTIDSYKGVKTMMYAISFSLLAVFFIRLYKFSKMGVLSLSISNAQDVISLMSLKITWPLLIIWIVMNIRFFVFPRYERSVNDLLVMYEPLDVSKYKEINSKAINGKYSQKDLDLFVNSEYQLIQKKLGTSLSKDRHDAFLSGK